MTAPSASPWKLTTSGLGVGDPALVDDAVLTAVGDGTAGDGVLTRYHRVVPSTSTVRRWLVRGPAWARSHPNEGTGAASSTTVVEAARSAGEVVLVEAVPEDEQLTQRTTTARAIAATGTDLLIAGILIIKGREAHPSPAGEPGPPQRGTAARPRRSPGCRRAEQGANGQ